jgi:ATP-dependent DNA ligase
VVEISYDHFTGGRFRHGTSILRWRPDKKPHQCTFEQLNQKIDRRLMAAIIL